MAPMTLGSNIRKARNKAKLTQKELGVRCGWGTDDKAAQTRISNYENDIREPTLADLKSIALVTETTIVQLIEGNEDTPKGELITLLENLKPEQQASILSIVRELSGIHKK